MHQHTKQEGGEQAQVSKQLKQEGAMQGQTGTSLSKAKDGPCTFPYLISTAAADGLDYARHGSLQDVVLVILQGQPRSLGIACELTTQLTLVASYMSLVWDHMPEPCLLCIQH